MYLKQAWNETKIVKEQFANIFAKKQRMLLGTKKLHSTMPKLCWIEDNKFLEQAVSILFRKDTRKPLKIIVIGPSRIGKTTLVSCIVDDLQNDYHVPVISIYPKGIDAVYHNQMGKGKLLCPGEVNRKLNNILLMPYYKEEDIPEEYQKHLQKFAFELYDFNPNTNPGFMEDDPKEYSKSAYKALAIMEDEVPKLKKYTAAQMLRYVDENTIRKVIPGSDKMYIAFPTYQSLRDKLTGCIANKFFFESKIKINEKMFIKSWNEGLSHAFMFFADPNDPRVQAYTAKIMQVAQRAKRRDNIYRRSKGMKERPAWIVVDDAREIVAEWMDFQRYRARREIENSIYLFGEDGWNILLVYHNVDDIPKGLLKEADYIICSKLDREGAKNLPDEEFRQTVQKLYVRSYNFYNEWACRSKDGTIRRFYAIDSPVGLK
jgi:hypothetical protein